MAGLFDGLFSVLGGGPAGPPPAPPIPAALAPLRPCSANGAHVLRTMPDQKYWQEQGWVYDERPPRLVGYYRTFHGAFKGRIDLSQTGDHEYFIKNPPTQLQQHGHAACFMYRGDGWYAVHFSTKPDNVDAGIQEIETVMRESKERYK